MSTVLASASKMRSRKTPSEISPAELHRWLTQGREIQIVDVREPHEFAAGHLPDARLIPLAQVSAHADELDPAVPTVVYCKGGSRSAKAISALREAGFTGPLVNLIGGILAWSKDVVPNLLQT
jgi:sulfur-carrier protein adenylyltransferase/sulfurtransferase